MGSGNGEVSQGGKPLVRSLSMAIDTEEGATHCGQERSRGKSKLLIEANSGRNDMRKRFSLTCLGKWRPLRMP